MSLQNYKQERDKKLSDVKLDYIKKYLHQETILDVGSGRCYYGDWIAEKFPESHIVALDHLNLDSNQLSPQITYHQVDLEQAITLPEKTFSTILAFDIIEHITQEKQFVSDLFRLCKPGGILIGSVPHDDDKFLPAYNLTFNHRSDLTHKRYYTVESLQATLTHAGFANITIDKHGGASPQVIAEFFPCKIQPIIKKCIGLLRRVGMINTKILASDLFFVAYKPAR